MLRKKITERDLVIKTGLSQPYINRVKNGYAIPTIYNAFRISRALGEKIEDVFGDQSEIRTLCT